MEVNGIMGLLIQSHTYEGECPRTPTRKKLVDEYIEDYRRSGELPDFMEKVSKEIISGGRARLTSDWIDSFCMMTTASDVPEAAY